MIRIRSVEEPPFPPPSSSANRPDATRRILIPERLADRLLDGQGYTLRTHGLLSLWDKGRSLEVVLGD